MEGHENAVAGKMFNAVHGLVSCPLCHNDTCVVASTTLYPYVLVERAKWDRIETRMKAYRFCTVVLFVLMALAALTIHTYNHEMSFAADQLRQANDRLREDREAFKKDLAMLKACQARVDLLATGRAAELLR
jgi:hypothetical protein